MGGAGLDRRGILNFIKPPRVGFVMSNQSSTSSMGPAPKKKRVADSKTLGYNIGVVGSGNMARAIVEGVLGSGRCVW